MLSQVDAVVRHCDVSLNTEPIILAALSDAADHQNVIHEVVPRVELGDLREGLASTDVLEFAHLFGQLSGLNLAGIGTNVRSVEPTLNSSHYCAARMPAAARNKKATSSAAIRTPKE